MTIYEAIPKIMAEIGAITKGKKNQQQGFMYRGVDDVMNALQPLLIKYNVFAVPEIINQLREERQTKSGGNLIYSVCTIKYTFFADDGSSIVATVIGEGMDSGDKATNKAMAIAFKYACFQVFCIPTEEMKDPDSETPPPVQPKSPHETPQKDPLDEILACKKCGTVFVGFEYEGKQYTAKEAYDIANKSFGGLCKNCRPKKAKAE